MVDVGIGGDLFWRHTPACPESPAEERPAWRNTSQRLRDLEIGDHRAGR
jgi:hypothetical protein